MIDAKDRARQLEIIGRIMGRTVSVAPSYLIPNEVTTVWKNGETWKQKPGQLPKLIRKADPLFDDNSTDSPCTPA